MASVLVADRERAGSCRHATTAPRPAGAGYCWLLEVLDEGDDEGALREEDALKPEGVPDPFTE